MPIIHEDCFAKVFLLSKVDFLTLFHAQLRKAEKTIYKAIANDTFDFSFLIR